jgi:hypothetical protein
MCGIHTNNNADQGSYRHIIFFDRTQVRESMAHTKLPAQLRLFLTTARRHDYQQCCSDARQV